MKPTRLHRRIQVACLVAATLLATAAGGGELATAAGGGEPAGAQEELPLLGPPDKKIIANPFRTGRSMTMSRNGLVATSHVLASEAGLQVLREGGNAMDAAVAASAVLGVVEPMMCGIGGDAYLLYYEAASGKVYALNGSGRSPKALTREYFAGKEKEKIEAVGWESVTVPGEVAAWEDAVERFGSKPLAELLQPAIHYAEEGFPVTETVASMWAAFGKALLEDPAAAKVWMPGGRAPEPGEVFKNPALAATLRAIAEGGADAFYRGELAEEMVRYSQERGGFFSLEDFAEHKSEWVEPITTNYRGVDVYQVPPNTQGATVLLMLNILEQFDVGAMEHGSPELVHLMLEAKKLAFADIEKFVGDPAAGEIPLDRLLSKEYAAERAKLIDMEKAMTPPGSGLPTHGDTIYLCAIDWEGNSVSFINSLFAGFGAKVAGGETGVVFQNRGSGFTLEPGHFNEYAPGKRPFQTIIPGMALKDGRLWLSFGLMGGDMQPQGHVQLLSSLIDHGYNIQQAVDFPRWRHEIGTLIFLEHGFPVATAEALKAKGHMARTMGGAMFGGAQVIEVDETFGTFLGASDPRKDGAALGY